MTYSVKLLFEIEVIGEPKTELLDEFYNGITYFYEQSIVMIKASSFDEAYEKAELYSKNEKDSYINKYGQTVTYTFYDYFDCFVLLEDVLSYTDDDFVECYSCYYFKDIDHSDKYKDFAERIMAQASPEETHQLRNL